MKLGFSLNREKKAELIKKGGHFLLCAAVIMLALKSNIYADDFTTVVKGFLSGTVVTWVRMIGALAVIGGAVGMITHPPQERIKMFWILIGTGVVIFAVPSIVNQLSTIFGSSTVSVFS